VAYVTYLILDSQQHGALPLMSQVMMGFVVPLTVVALVASLIRQPSTPA
jgi:cation:H+ antiporter